MTIKKNDKVKIDYEGRLENGDVFDSSQHGDHSHPLEFTVGAGEVIKGFDEAVLGLNIGEEKEFEIFPEEGYGEYREELKREIPRNVLPPNQTPEEGMTLIMETKYGQIPGKLIHVDNQKVIVDLNHPLAGKKLIFKIKVKSIN